MTDTIAPEIGKFYRTRDGFCAGPIERSRGGDNDMLLSAWIPGTGGRLFRRDGAHFYGNTDLDLVAEWTDADEPVLDVKQQLADDHAIAEAMSRSRDGVPLYSAAHPFGEFSAGSLEEVEIDLPDRYLTIRTQVPPTLALEHGKLTLTVTDGQRSIVAEIGDGAWFFGRLVELLINPALRTAAAVRELVSKND